MTELKESVTLETSRLESALERLEKAVEKNARMAEEKSHQQATNKFLEEIDALKDELRKLHNRHNEMTAELSDISLELVHTKKENMALREINARIGMMLKKSIGEIEGLVG